MTEKSKNQDAAYSGTMDRRRFIGHSGTLIAGGIVASAFPALALAREKKRPLNILLLMSDQHGPDSLGYYGDHNALTPNLDRLASSGYSMRQAYCQSPVCVSSRNSILNGCYPHSNGVISNAYAGNRDILSFPQVLRKKGYTTGCFGKLHTPGREDLDWDEYNEGSRNPGMPVPEGGVILSGTANLLRDPAIGAPDPFPKTTTLEWQAKENAIRFMRENKDRPWLIQCSMHKPHPPFQPPLEYWNKIDRSKLVIPEFPENDLDDASPRYKKWIMSRGFQNITREQILDGMQGHYGNLAFVDDLFGEVLNELESLGLRENTLVVYLVDHGEMLHRHGLWTKFVFFDASVRVPLIFSLPGTFAAGKQSNALVELIDLFPTLTEMTGCDNPETVQGKSLVSLLTGKTRHHRKVVHSEYPLSGMNKPGGPYYATMMLFDGRYKLVDNGPDIPPELYDQKKDPGEFTNIAGEEKQQKRVEKMLAELREWHLQDAVPVQPRWRDLRRMEE